MNTEASPLSRTALKDLRLKPAPGQEPIEKVWSHKRRGYIGLFDPRQCIPMRAKREASAAQLAALEAGRRKLTHANCVGCGQSTEKVILDRRRTCPACLQAQWLAAELEREERRFADLAAFVRCAPIGRTIYLDTETTGLRAGADELLELAIVDDDGAILFESLVKPVSRGDWPGAQAIHGIAPEDVVSAPPLAELLPQLRAIFEAAEALVIYNAEFDLAFLPEPLRALAQSKAVCAMETFGLFVGEWDERLQSYRWCKLAHAASIAGHVWIGCAHRARADALAARSVWHWLRAEVDRRGESSPSAIGSDCAPGSPAPNLARDFRK